MNIKDWTPPPGFKAGDSVKLAGLTGANTDPAVTSFAGWNLAELVAWRKANRGDMQSPQKQRYAAAQNAAMARAVPGWRNVHDDENGIRDPETGEWLHPPVPKAPKQPKAAKPRRKGAL